MKNISTSFAMPPHQDPHKYFHNLCLEFRKLLHASKDSDQLEFEMVKLINASKDMTWKHKNCDVYRKDEGEKACKKVWHEFSRYSTDLKKNITSSSFQDLLDAIDKLLILLKTYDVK